MWDCVCLEQAAQSQPIEQTGEACVRNSCVKGDNSDNTNSPSLAMWLTHLIDTQPLHDDDVGALVVPR